MPCSTYPQNFRKKSVHNFSSYLANTQTNKQTNKVWQKHNLLGGGNQTSKQKWRQKFNLNLRAIKKHLRGFAIWAVIFQVLHFFRFATWSIIFMVLQLLRYSLLQYKKWSHRLQFEKFVFGQRQAWSIGLNKFDENRHAVVVSSSAVSGHAFSHKSLAARYTPVRSPPRPQRRYALSTN